MSESLQNSDDNSRKAYPLPLEAKAEVARLSYRLAQIGVVPGRTLAPIAERSEAVPVGVGWMKYLLEAIRQRMQEGLVPDTPSVAEGAEVVKID